MAETHRRIRWVRFGKRTHRRGLLGSPKRRIGSFEMQNGGQNGGNGGRLPYWETYGRSMCAVGRPAHNMGAAWL